MGKCKWCHEDLPGKHSKCDKCKSLYSKYSGICSSIRRGERLETLLYCRNFLFDMKFNMPGAVDLPKDLDYQYDKVTRYISEM